MKVYLAARYSRRDELNRHRRDLERLGFAVNSRWLAGSHEITGEDSQTASEEARRRFAAEDWCDVTDCDICISFTEEPRGSNSRGGRHVEFGAALALGKRIIVVGYRENVFHCLPDVEFYDNWLDCLAAMRG